MPTVADVLRRYGGQYLERFGGADLKIPRRASRLSAVVGMGRRR